MVGMLRIQLCFADLTPLSAPLLSTAGAAVVGTLRQPLNFRSFARQIDYLVAVQVCAGWAPCLVLAATLPVGGACACLVSCLLAADFSW